MSKAQKTAKSPAIRKSRSNLLARTAQRLWKQVFIRALKQYGRRAQAERIANCALTPDVQVPVRKAKAVASAVKAPISKTMRKKRAA